MYRYSVDNAVTYTSEDVVLFKESPFASFMERLTLENPGHGIPPDLDTSPPQDTITRQDDLAETLRAEQREVSLIDWDAEEPIRRTATLEAMRHGVDFIVNGQLALGPLSGSANLLMRTSGYSELGSYLYIPCDTQGKTGLQSAFRLCFLADLLHSLQGQLPPQMLIIRGGSDVLPLKTEDHIFHYLAVKQRFMLVQREFRKHRMPNPAESSAFGRWSDCANEVMKQRMLAAAEESELAPLPESEPEMEAPPVALAVGESEAPQSSQVASDVAATALPESSAPPYHKGLRVSDTLAAQAQSLSTSPGFGEAAPVAPPAPAMPTAEPPVDVPHTTAYVPGGSERTEDFDSLSVEHGAVEDHPPEALVDDDLNPPGPVVDRPEPLSELQSEPTPSQLNDETPASGGLENSDAALMNLQFIGSRLGSTPTRTTDSVPPVGRPERRRSRQEPPPQVLGDMQPLVPSAAEIPVVGESSAPDEPGVHPLDTEGFNIQASLVDRDELPPRVKRTESGMQLDEYGENSAPDFSSSLITNDVSKSDD